MPPENMTDDEYSAAGPADGAGSGLAWGTTSFEPGHDVGLVARHTVGLIERDNPSTRERLWGLVSSDAALDDILDELSSTGLKSLPDFGLAQVEGSSVRIVARGRATVAAQLSTGEIHLIDPTDVRTWIEELVDDVDSITITLAALDGDDSQQSDEAFAVLAGSVPASSMTRRFDVEDDHADIAQSGAGWSAHDSAPAQEAPGEPENAPEPASDVVESLDVADAPLDVSESSSVPAQDDAWSPEQPTDDVESSESLPSDPQPSYPQPPAPPPPPPGVAPDASEAVEDAVGSDDTGDSEPSFGADVDGEQSTRCVLVFSDGERIDVDRSILIGRNPKVADDVEGESPHIMKFDGPGQGLSRTHAEVRQEDGRLVIEDLHSTNGTEVQLPGQARRRLVGGEPVAIVPGTTIDFGDELQCTLESAD